MYPRKNPNRSGTISVVVVSKSHCKTRYVHNMGTVETEAEADALLLKAHDWILRHLVIARVSQPLSKLATVSYLKSYYVEHTRKILGVKIGLMFYDVSTLYFETSKTDALREPASRKTVRRQSPRWYSDCL